MGQEYDPDSLPFPLGPPEQIEEWNKALASRRIVVAADKVLEDLRELVEKWRDTCYAERKALTGPREIHALPLEYSAGMAQGLECAAADLEKVIADNS